MGEGGPECLHDRIFAGRQEGPVGTAESFHEIERGLDRGWLGAFDLEVEASVRELGECFFERRNAVPPVAVGGGSIRVPKAVARVETLDVGPIAVDRRAPILGDAIQIGIVQEDGHAVSRHVNVALEDMCTAA